MQRTPFWNPERITFAVFGGLLFWASWSYLFSMPPSIEAELEANPARSALSETEVRSVDAFDTTQDPGHLSRDPFALQVLTGLARLNVKDKPRPPRPRPNPNPNPNPQPNPNVPVNVVLPRKPVPREVVKPQPGPEPEGPEEKKPFPLIVTGILRFEADASGRRVLVKRREGDGSYMELREDDEVFVGPGETVKVIEITPTAVTFETSEGRHHRITKDPLEAWRPKLRDESDVPATAREEPALEDFLDDSEFEIETLDLGPGAELQPQPEDSPRRRHEIRGPADGEVRQSDLERLMRQIKEQNPDLLDQLGTVY